MKPIIPLASLVLLLSISAPVRGADPTAGAPGSTVGPLQKQLIGFWKLVSLERKEDPEGEWGRPYGDNPKGCFYYGEKGQLSVQIMRVPAAPPFASEDYSQGTCDEVKAVYFGYIALFGTYTVDETKRIVVQHIEGSILPHLVGEDMIRTLEFTGNRLILGDPRWLRIVLERVQ